MFSDELKISGRPKMTPAKAAKAKEIANNIRWNRNNREDIGTGGYRAYLYHLKQVSEVQDKEHEQLIISAADMDGAIETFKSECLRGDYYENAEFNITLMGVDFEPDREEKIIMAY